MQRLSSCRNDLKVVEFFGLGLFSTCDAVLSTSTKHDYTFPISTKVSQNPFRFTLVLMHCVQKKPGKIIEATQPDKEI